MPFYHATATIGDATVEAIVEARLPSQAKLALVGAIVTVEPIGIKEAIALTTSGVQVIDAAAEKVAKEVESEAAGE